MRAQDAFLSIFAPLALISACAARKNHFDCKISNAHHDLEIICTKFHSDRSKNAGSTRFFVQSCTFDAGLPAETTLDIKC